MSYGCNFKFINPIIFKKPSHKLIVASSMYICTWKLYKVKRGVGIGYLMPVCDGLDNLEHVQQCQFYYTKWYPAWVTDDEHMAKYIVKLKRERTKCFKMPIL